MSGHAFDQIFAAINELKSQVADIDRRVEDDRRKADARKWLSITEAALAAGYSYSRFRTIRTEFGFEPGAKRVRADRFYAALARRGNGNA